MSNFRSITGFHDALLAENWSDLSAGHWSMGFTYTFDNFFHPFVGELIAKLNTESLPAMLDPAWLASLRTPDPETNAAQDFFHNQYHPHNDRLTHVASSRKSVDVSAHGSYAIYNWELFFHLPVTIAVHLSK